MSNVTSHNRSDGTSAGRCGHAVWSQSYWAVTMIDRRTALRVQVSRSSPGHRPLPLSRHLAWRVAATIDVRRHWTASRPASWSVSNKFIFHIHESKSLAQFVTRRSMYGAAPPPSPARFAITSCGTDAIQIPTAINDQYYWNCLGNSCPARAERTLFLTESARTLTHFIMQTHFTFF